MFEVDEIFTIKIKEVFDGAQVPLVEIAKSLETTPSTLQRWKNGETFPPMKTIPRIEKYFKKPPGWFFGVEELRPERDALVLRGINALQKVKEIEHLESFVDIVEDYVASPDVSTQNSEKA